MDKAQNTSKSFKEAFNMQVKVAEFVGESPNSWQEAIENAVSEASRSLNNITGVEVYNWTANCEQNMITEYKANIKIAYVE
jgi:flavin-binding protein dodecin